jgi:glycine oxidase
VKVAIAGGGVIGCAIAYYLQTAGASVVLLERGEIGGEASSAAAGMLIAPIEDAGHRAFNNLRRASLTMYPDLLRVVQARSGIDVEYKQPGMLRTARSDESARELRKMAKRHPGLQWVDGRALKQVEPLLSPRVVGAAYSARDADLNPGLLTKALGAAAARSGADVREGTMLTGFTGKGPRLTGVGTNLGDVSSDAVVIAAGPWTEPLSLRLKAPLATPPMRGQMIAYRSDALHHAVWGEDGYLVPKPGGLVFAGATIEDVGFRKSTTTKALNGLRRMAAGLVPDLAQAEVAQAWAGLRPGSPDGMPIIGRVPGKDNVFVATGHFRNGILLAPITGKLVADLVLTGEADRRLRPFSPGRFRKTATA